MPACPCRVICSAVCGGDDIPEPASVVRKLLVMSGMCRLFETGWYDLRWLIQTSRSYAEGVGPPVSCSSITWVLLETAWICA